MPEFFDLENLWAGWGVAVGGAFVKYDPKVDMHIDGIVFDNAEYEFDIDFRLRCSYKDQWKKSRVL